MKDSFHILILHPMQNRGSMTALFYLDTPDPTETSKMTMEVKTTRARALIVSQGMNDNGLPVKENTILKVA